MICAPIRARDKYQFLFTIIRRAGRPHSALQREEMAAFDKVYGRQHNMILVGHSMGGSLRTRSSPWPDALGWSLAKCRRILPEVARIPSRQADPSFQANPKSARGLFAPPSGSKLAVYRSLVFSRVHKLPFNILSAAAMRPAVHRTPSAFGVNRLSPSNPLYPLDKVVRFRIRSSAIAAEAIRRTAATASSILGSHLKGAQSELIVPGPHSSQSLPVTIAELKRS